MPQLWSQGRGPYALLALLLFTIFVIPPVVNNGWFMGIYEVMIALVLIEGIFAVPYTPSLRFVAICIVVFAVVARALHWFTQNETFAFAEIISAILAIGLFVALIVRQYLTRETIKHRIAGAIVVYLLIGLLFARLYELDLLLDPHAFTMRPGEDTFTMIYFSFVTLLTIGYGDVVPSSSEARHLAIFEGFLGQLYLVVFISSLVAQLVRDKKHNIEN